jgi:hypothetical protein
MATREAGRSSQTLDAADGSAQSSKDEAPALFRGLRPISKTPLRLATTARFLESYGELCCHHPSIRSCSSDHDSSFKLPFLLQREAGRSIIFSIPHGGTNALAGLPCM